MERRLVALMLIILVLESGECIGCACVAGTVLSVESGMSYFFKTCMRTGELDLNEY